MIIALITIGCNCALYDVNNTDYPVFEHGKYRRFDLNLRS